MKTHIAIVMAMAITSAILSIMMASAIADAIFESPCRPERLFP